jgi:hypothetical protein
MYTTFRIQHLGGMTIRRRQARYEKYRQADPDSHYWPDYTVLLDETPADQLQMWERRDPATPSLYLDAVADDAVEEHSLTVIAAPSHRGLVVDSPDYELIVSADPDAVLDRCLVEGASGSIVLALPPDVVPNEAALSTIVPGARRRLRHGRPRDRRGHGHELVHPVEPVALGSDEGRARAVHPRRPAHLVLLPPHPPVGGAGVGQPA